MGSRLRPRLGTGKGQLCGPASEGSSGHSAGQRPMASLPLVNSCVYAVARGCSGRGGTSLWGPWVPAKKVDISCTEDDPENPPCPLPGAWGPPPPVSTPPAPLPRGPSDSPAPSKALSLLKVSPSLPFLGTCLRPPAQTQGGDSTAALCASSRQAGGIKGRDPPPWPPGARTTPARAPRGPRDSGLPRREVEAGRTRPPAEFPLRPGPSESPGDHMKPLCSRSWEPSREEGGTEP